MTRVLSLNIGLCSDRLGEEDPGGYIHPVWSYKKRKKNVIFFRTLRNRQAVKHIIIRNK